MLFTFKGLDSDRYIRGTYTTIEINYAISLGYKVHHVYEIWHWDKQEKIFEKFMQLLMRKKIMYSGLPANATSDYCDTVNNTLQLEGNFKLKLDDIKNDAAGRKYYKLLSCVF